MGLPLLVGIITYILIILSLTVWLAKYHAYIYQNPNSKENSDVKDQDYKQPLNPDAGLPEKNSQTNFSSGNESLAKDHKGVFRQDK